MFLGSGLLFLAMIFVAMSVAEGLAKATDPATAAGVHMTTIDVGKMMVLSAATTYATRMVAVFTIPLATIWLRTELMLRPSTGCSEQVPAAP
ncbi:hypothetical protein [Mycolicibacterium thermoresistibile]